MHTVDIDFETRSTVDIYTVGAWGYAEHPTTDVLCIQYSINGQDPTLITQDALNWKDIPKDLKDAIQDIDFIFFAHNAFFERAIWINLLKSRYGWGYVSRNRWRCTLAMASACALPKALAKVGAVLELSTQKDVSGARIMKKLSRPKKKVAENERIQNETIWHENPQDLRMLYDYCAEDVKTEQLLSKSIPALPWKEQKIWELDQKINERGVQIDIPTVEKIKRLILEYTNQLKGELSGLTDGYLDSVSRIQRVITWVESQNVQIKDLRKETIQQLLTQDLPEKVKRVLYIRQQLSKSSTTKYQAMLDRTDSNHRLRDQLQYHSASTGRWGGKGVQLQNLPKEEIDDQDFAIKVMCTGNLETVKFLYPNFTNAASACIRGMIIAAPKHELFVADYSTIEFRVLMWLVQDKKTLHILEDSKKDIYADMAQQIYEIPVAAKKNSEQRNLGKAVVLGCGYGMGMKRFKETCEDKKVFISEKLAQKAVNAYREAYPLVVATWYAQGHTAIAACKTSEVLSCGKIKWAYRGDFLICQLPSKRNLYYFKPEIQDIDSPYGSKPTLTYMTVDSQTQKFIRTRTWGSKIIGNICQAIARDIMAEAMLRCEAKGFPIIFTVHDEIVAEVPKGTKTLTAYIDTLCKLPKWAEECPIRAEGWIGQRYKK